MMGDFLDSASETIEIDQRDSRYIFPNDTEARKWWAGSWRQAAGEQ